jgi:proline iminopeptidase
VSTIARVWFVLCYVMFLAPAAWSSAAANEVAVHEERYVTIGGIPQWISIRTRSTENPILVVLHGGPGFTVSPVSYHFMRDWEEYFTVVQWDQRGAGKTYRRETAEAIRPTLSIDRLVSDAEELVQYLTQRFDQQRVVVYGFSFGTIVGVKLAQRRPDLLHAYVGSGQFVDFMRGEALGYQATLADAKADGNDEAIAALESIAPFPDPNRPERNLENLPTERRWLAHYGGYFAGGGEGQHFQIAAQSPLHTDADREVWQEAHDYSVLALWDEIGAVNFSAATRFKVPVILLQGRHDRGTSSSLVEEWYSKLKAPRKRLIWFERSSHMAFEEEPGKMLVSLVNEVLPLTRSR